ncbi:ABC transporter permease [Desulfogranum japonicum]|uniref:ABC transporter permease n=1 Tax=Desulfogranum japonicum TaxID=231447 RepID=UPI00048F19A1|nr:ABC transporter permease [Desulfogranum japonicum]
MKLARFIILAFSSLLLWQVLVWSTGIPVYILPGPWVVYKAIISHWSPLIQHLGTTFMEIVLGLVFGIVLGSCSALAMTLLPGLRRWMLPMLVVSQAVPVFALAPILVLWLGYGMGSKVAMAVLIIYFPVTSSFFYGMQRTNPDLLELARVMEAKQLAVFRFIIIPAAMPAFASGVRVAAAVAPIGAIVGEWVGSSSGLGFYMLHANARMQVDVMFAALTLLAAVSLTLYFSIDFLLSKILYWESKQGYMI